MTVVRNTVHNYPNKIKEYALKEETRNKDRSHVIIMSTDEGTDEKEERVGKA